MEIVKIKTNKRVLYAIRISKPGWFTEAKYASLRCYDKYHTTWTQDSDYFLRFCTSEDLVEVTSKFAELTAPEERILKVIPRKCQCK